MYKLIHPERGTRQYDPISPYMFIISTEYLGRCIHFATSQLRSDIGLN